MRPLAGLENLRAEGAHAAAESAQQASARAGGGGVQGVPAPGTSALPKHAIGAALLVQRSDGSYSECTILSYVSKASKSSIASTQPPHHHHNHHLPFSLTLPPSCTQVLPLGGDGAAGRVPAAHAVVSATSRSEAVVSATSRSIRCRDDVRDVCCLVTRCRVGELSGRCGPVGTMWRCADANASRGCACRLVDCVNMISM